MPTSAGAVLRLQDLRVGYDDLTIVQGVSLSVFPGEIVSVLGPNGAGKSTVLKAIMGYLRPTGGQIWFGGAIVSRKPTHQVVRMGIGYVPQGRIVFERMSVSENLEVGGFILEPGVREKRLREVLEFFPRLRERRGQIAGTLSGGEQQMIAIARAMMTRPQLLLLDEPSLGLSPLFVDTVFRRLTELNQAGMTMLMVEQNATKALSISHRGYILELGRNRFEGPGSELLADQRIRDMYFGG